MSPERRVLMVTGAWPPVGRIGARRPLRLARRLPALGWVPLVLTPHPDAMPFLAPPPRDPSLQAPDVEVVRVGGHYPGLSLRRAGVRSLERLGQPRLAWLLTRLTDGWQIPDHFTEWVPAAVCAARARGPVDVVWVTGGPFGIFIAGAAVASAMGAPLVLDYRDPWTQGPRSVGHPFRVPNRVLEAVEARILRRAAGVAYINEEVRAANRARFGQPEGVPWVVIPNGFDETDLPDVPPLKPDRPTVVYAGGCYGSRSMRPILEALAAGFGPGESGLCLRVFGELDRSALQFLEANPLPGRVRVEARLPICQLAAHLRGADALLLIVGEDHRAALTGKLFDYVLAGRPVLGYGPADSDAAALVDRTGMGRWIRSGDQPGLIEALRSAERGDLPFHPVPAAIAELSADGMAARTAELLDRVARRSA